MGSDEKRFLSLVGAVLGGIIAMVFAFGSWSVVSPGYTGVVFNKVTGGLYVVGQGIVFKIPFVTKVQSYPVALRTYTMVAKTGEGSNNEDDSIDLPTLEGQHIRQDISVTYNTSETKADQVFRSFRGSDIEDIESSFIRRTIITVAQNAAGQMSLSELISSKRGTLQSSIQENLAGELAKMGFTLDKVNLGASHLPKSIEEQMQQKMAAQQQAQQAQYEYEKATILAKAHVAEARGEADSRVIQAEASAKSNNLLRQSLTAELIRLRMIEKWNGELPRITGSNASVIRMEDFLSNKTKE